MTDGRWGDPERDGEVTVELGGAAWGGARMRYGEASKGVIM